VTLQQSFDERLAYTETERTDLDGGATAGLWSFADRARRNLRAPVGSLGDAAAATPRRLAYRDGNFTLTPRKLLLHITVREIRHWARVATAARNAGLVPPGRHELFHGDALR